MLSYGACLCLLMVTAPASAGEFVLVGPEEEATILVPASEPECVRLAVDDLVGDVQRITGRKLRQVGRHEECSAHSVVIATASQPESSAILRRVAPDLHAALQGKWEAYRVQDGSLTEGSSRRGLMIAGSDERGTIFAIYAFCEQYLGVDPMHFWTDRTPQKRPTLSWPEIHLSADEPTFRYRGWFINDEDLVTGWQSNPATRAIDYKFYRRMLAPAVAEQIYEAMLRLQYNLVIPSSFIDLRNPDEARLVDLAVRRGLCVSMHHQEPLGVTGLYTFPNYWQARGEEVPFSFVSHREKFAEIWRDYVRLWSRYGDHVVWQLGLRGKGDRPLWATDPKAPATDADRGRLISEAMALQWEIVRSIDRRPHPPATSTLWMEGSALHRAGHLQFPPGVAAIFSDNNPGWKMQADFFDNPRESGRPYGIYYHQALWNTGPHFCQAVSPRKMQEIFKLAVDRGDTFYALLNVSNVREFALGVDAASRLLRDYPRFDPDAFLARWCRERFTPVADAAQRCYEAYFASYSSDGPRGRRRLDAETLLTGGRVLRALADRIGQGKNSSAQHGDKLRGLLRETREHREALDRAGQEVDTVLAGLKGESRTFFEANFVAQHRMMRGLVGWLESIVLADLAHGDQHPDELLTHARAAETHLRDVRAAQALASQGKWKGWYDHDDLMDLASAEEATRQLLSLVAVTTDDATYSLAVLKPSPGSRIMIRAPRPGAVSKSRCPRKRARRARMLNRPKPAVSGRWARLAGSKPTPSSPTSICSSPARLVRLTQARSVRACLTTLNSNSRTI